MLRNRWIRYLALALVAAVPVAAGEYKKCTASTQDCLNYMATKMKDSGFVGIEYDMDETTRALSVIRVIPDSPAAAAGLQPGDVLYAMNGVDFNSGNEEELKKARKDWKPGQAVTYSVKRGGIDHEVTITLAPMPADVLAKYIGEHMLAHAAVEIAENQ